MDLLHTSLKLDPYLSTKIQRRSKKLFQSRGDQPQLEASEIHKTRSTDARWSLYIKSRASINSYEELCKTKRNDDSLWAKIYTIRHIRSWTPLNISHDLFNSLICTEDVFHHFWGPTLAFGRRTDENEYAFPGFRSQSLSTSEGKATELSYVIRRVERNYRSVDYGENPWSVRQTGVYHKLNIVGGPSQHKSTYILIAPSPTVEMEFAECLSANVSDDGLIQSPFTMHQRLVIDSLRGWMDYMVWIENETKQISNRVLASSINRHKYEIYFDGDHRQQLKKNEDYITDMQVILQTMRDTIARIGQSCLQHCRSTCRTPGSCSCSYMIQEFEEHAAEVRLYLERVDVLKARVQSTSELVADLLAHYQAEVLKEENENVMKLNKRAVEDAAAVKMLTIIGLVFLPLTIVANFFSTQFVKINDQDHLHISHDVWYMGAVAVPLTAFTFLLWWGSLRLNSPGTLPWTQGEDQAPKANDDTEKGLGAPWHGKAPSFPMGPWDRQFSYKPE